MDSESVHFEKSGGETILHLKGALDWRSVGGVWRDTRRIIEETSPQRLALDLREVQEIDSSGVAYLRSVHAACEGVGADCLEQNVPERIEEFLRYTKEHSRERLENPPPPRLPDFATRTGMKTKSLIRSTYHTISFFGEFMLALVGQIRHPRGLKPQDIFYQMQMAGVGAVPLIVGLSFLLGMLMVFQGSTTLQGFGPKIFIADMVVIAVTKEMGPLLVGVVLAGRSGAAFAAEIGTMKVNEELDALTVMDLDVTRLIILPRVFALTLAEPILTMVSDVVGILGGLTTSHVVEGIPIDAFVHEIRKTLSASDIYSGLIKSVTFGLLVGLIGCYSGLRTGLGSESVGVQTTSAVVSGIFVIILLDTIFSYVFSFYGW